MPFPRNNYPIYEATSSGEWLMLFPVSLTLTVVCNAIVEVRLLFLGKALNAIPSRIHTSGIP